MDRHGGLSLQILYLQRPSNTGFFNDPDEGAFARGVLLVRKQSLLTNRLEYEFRHDHFPLIALDGVVILGLRGSTRSRPTSQLTG